jgi:energy-coupling factor transporter transmembrane protein EcfT
MSTVTAFDYQPGHTFLHRLDVRCKLTGFGLMNMAGLNAGPMGLSLLTLVVLSGMLTSGLPVRGLLKELRFFYLLLIFVGVSRALTTPGPTLWAVGPLTATAAGVVQGALFCWRLTLIVFLGWLLITSTRPTAIKAGVQWFLAPLPFVPAKRVGIMLSLMVRFLPLILTESGRITDAQRARGIENRRNPWFRLTAFGRPFIRRVFQLSDRLIVAMEARCYTEDRTDPELTATPVDVLVLLGLIGLALTLWWL